MAVQDTALELDRLYKARNEALSKQDFKLASDLHFEFHRLAYSEWPQMSAALKRGKST